MSRKYAILGETLKHTMSPPIHARLFELKGREFEYEILEVKPEELKDKAERLAGEIRRTTHNLTVEVEACKDQVGGGSAPTVLLDGYAVAVQGRTLAPEKIERLLRKEEIPIIIRITHNQVYLDVRTIREDEFEYIVAAFTAMDSRQVEG